MVLEQQGVVGRRDRQILECAMRIAQISERCRSILLHSVRPDDRELRSENRLASPEVSRDATEPRLEERMKLDDLCPPRGQTLLLLL